MTLARIARVKTIRAARCKHLVRYAFNISSCRIPLGGKSAR